MKNDANFSLLTNITTSINGYGTFSEPSSSESPSRVKFNIREDQSQLEHGHFRIVGSTARDYLGKYLFIYF
jgi:hypothetical protein